MTSGRGADSALASQGLFLSNARNIAVPGGGLGLRGNRCIKRARNCGLRSKSGSAGAHSSIRSQSATGVLHPRVALVAQSSDIDRARTRIVSCYPMGEVDTGPFGNRLAIRTFRRRFLCRRTRQPSSGRCATSRA
jgi:hypothetical protein